MRKTAIIILLIFLTAFSIKAVEADTPDSLEISYDHVYAVDRTVNVYPVANVIAFPQDYTTDKVVDAMLSPTKKSLFRRELYAVLLSGHIAARSGANQPPYNPGTIIE